MAYASFCMSCFDLLCDPRMFSKENQSTKKKHLLMLSNSKTKGDAPSRTPLQCTPLWEWTMQLRECISEAHELKHLLLKCALKNKYVCDLVYVSSFSENICSF